LKQIRLIAFICLFTLLLFTVSARGQEGYEVYEIRFEGPDTLSAEMLLDQMNTSEAGLLEKLAFWKEGPRFSSTMFENDLERLRRSHQRNGFLDPRVDYRLRKDDRKKRLRIDMEIKEGKAVTIRSIRYELQEDSLSQVLLEEIEEASMLRAGMRFSDNKVFEEENRIKNAYINHGYPYVVVRRSLEVFPEKHTVEVLFHIEPGTHARFGEVRIHGDSLVPRSFILKKLAFSPGQVYAHNKLDATQSRLFNTDLFRYVVIRPRKDSISNQRIPVYLEVRESPPWSLEGGVGYGTEDRFRASVRLTKLQFLGGNRKFIFEGRHSHFLPISVETRFIQPALLGERLDMLVNPFFVRENERSYEVDRLGGGLTFQENFSPATSAYLMYSFERVFLQELSSAEALEEKKIRNKAGLTLGFDRNTSNSRFDPSSGWRMNGHFTYMGIGFRSRFHYYKAEMKVIRYYRLAEDWIVAAKLRAGFIEPLRGEQSPIEDRFLLGGASSLRGWGRHSISPLNEEGLPVGGNSMFESSLELRFPIYDIFSGVIFTDFGNVWGGAFSPHMADLRYDAGLGFRVHTPVGPVRLDLAAPVFENSFAPRFYVSIGHAF